MKNNFPSFALGLLMVVPMFSCQRNNFKEFVGPAICPSNSFAFTSPFVVQSNGLETNKVDFSLAEIVSIQANMNEEVQWQIKIKGKTTGAVKRFSGKGKSINLKWYGEPDSSNFFGIENCDVTLSLPCKDDIKSNISLTGKTQFNAAGKFILINDFDNNGLSMQWYPYGALSTATPSFTPPVPSPQGGNCYRIICKADVPVWYFGGTGTQDPKVTQSFPRNRVISPDSVYFNCYLNSNGKTSTEVAINITQSVGNKTKRVVVNWTGWKYVSFSLGSIGITNPALTTGVDFSIGAAPTQATEAEAWVDMVMYTIGAPLLVE